MLGVRTLVHLPRLRELFVAQAGLGADVIPVLVEMKSLRKVDLRGNPIDPTALRRLPARIEQEK